MLVVGGQLEANIVRIILTWTDGKYFVSADIEGMFMFSSSNNEKEIVSFAKKVVNTLHPYHNPCKLYTNTGSTGDVINAPERVLGMKYEYSDDTLKWDINVSLPNLCTFRKALSIILCLARS